MLGSIPGSTIVIITYNHLQNTYNLIVTITLIHKQQILLFCKEVNVGFSKE